MLLIFVLAIYYSPWLRVKEVQILTDNGVQLPSAVREHLEDLRREPIFSRAINRQVRSLATSRADIVDLSCGRGLPSTLRCQVSFRVPKLLWQRNGQQWLVDETGLAYERATGENPELITVEDQSTGQLTAPVGVVSREVIEGYWEVKNSLAVRNIRLEKVIVGDALYHFRPQVRQWQLLYGGVANDQVLDLHFSLNHSLDNQLASLFTLLTQKGTAIIDRVDLRVPGSIYYH